MKTVFNKVMVTASLSLMTPFAFANKAVEQASIWQQLVDVLAVVAMSVLFLVGMVILLYSAVAFTKDYILSKGPQDEKFSIGKVIAGIVVGSFLAYPSGTFVIGTALISDDAAPVQDSDFRRPPADTGGNG